MIGVLLSGSLVLFVLGLVAARGVPSHQARRARQPLTSPAGLVLLQHQPDLLADRRPAFGLAQTRACASGRCEHRGHTIRPKSRPTLARYPAAGGPAFVALRPYGVQQAAGRRRARMPL
jgi:hypothetical protein